MWALLTPKNLNPRSRIHHIAVAAIYFSGSKSKFKNELYDHIAETYHYLLSKYGSKLHFLICGDTNRLSLKPILNLSPDLKQEVKVFTRLNPPAILDPIITTLGKYYQPSISMPPVDANPHSGVPSDHLVILMKPLVSETQLQPRVYQTITSRPFTRAGLEKFAMWIERCDWSEIYGCDDVNEMASTFQQLLLTNFQRCFPEKSKKVCGEDKPWISAELKKLDRQIKREFAKNKKSKKWSTLREIFEKKCNSAKEKYYFGIVEDLKVF